MQFGFTKGRSVKLNLLTLMQCVSPVLFDRGQLDVILLDLAKAFDMLAHTMFINKCKLYGVSEDFAVWLASFLKDRVGRVGCNGHIGS